MNEDKQAFMAGLAPLPIDVVSVQSQVVYGRVGNSVAVRTFETHGLHVAPVPTVLLGSVPHYDNVHGGVVPDAWFAGWLEDLVARRCLERLRLVQLGYLGNVAQAHILASWIATRRAATPALQVLIDPVIGDHANGIYVEPALVPVYRDTLLPLADGLTPNDFELALLTGMPTADMEQVVAAARSLLYGRVRWIVVTSAAPQAWPVGAMRVAVVTPTDVHVIEHPHVDAAPKGTGDLFSASLATELLAGTPLEAAARNACNAVVAAVRLTHQQHSAELLLPSLAQV